MNLKTDKKKSPLKGVYIFYSVIIALCILALFVFNLNIYAKAVLCTLAFLCVCIMRSLKNAMILPPDIEYCPLVITRSTFLSSTNQLVYMLSCIIGKGNIVIELREIFNNLTC